MRLVQRVAGIALTLLFFMAAGLQPSAAGTGEPVDVELVLAVDISGSMDFEEQRAQRDGYVQAFRSPEVHKAVASGQLGKIAVTYVGWAGMDIQMVFVPWTLVDGKKSAEAFADQIAKSPLGTYRGTSISHALIYAAALIEKSAFTGTRQTIDISGDGPNNMGMPVLQARTAVLAKGITINGLPLMLPGHDSSATRNLDEYYRDCVVGGPASFMYTIRRLEEFPAVIRRKLIQEIADWPTRPPTVIPAQAAGPACPERPMFYQP